MDNQTINEYKIVGLGNVSLERSSRQIQPLTDGLDSSAKIKIDSGWKQAVLNSNGSLFDGMLLNCLKVETLNHQVLIEGNFIEYKFFWAQKHFPELKLNITPIGISGLIVTYHESVMHVVFARRTNHNFQYKGHYELIPSGSIDDSEPKSKEINFYNQLLVELKEEAGLGIENFTKIASLGLLLDTRDNVLDIACLLETKADREQLRRQIILSDEYQDLEFIPVDELPQFLRENKENVVPTSIGVIEIFNEFKRNV
jgi:hypothetical protein